MGLHESVMKDIHTCQIKTTLDDGLEKVPPQEPSYKKFLAKLRTVTAISESNTRTKDFFHSHAAVIAEKQRHIKSGYVYVIHPLSMFTFYRERILILLWLITFFKNTFTTAFISWKAANLFWKIFDHTVDILLFVDVIINFYTGYEQKHPCRIELRKKHIVIHYLCTYFIFDLLGTIPFSDLAHYILKINDDLQLSLLSLLRIFRFARLLTMLRYIEQMGYDYNLSDAAISMICQTIMTLYYLHWIACIAYIIPCLSFNMMHSFPEKSWVSQAQLEPFRKYIPIVDRYVNCGLCAMCHFFGAGVGMYATDYPPEQIFFSIVLTLGCIYCQYVTALLMQIFCNINVAENKYEEMFLQLEEYIRSKKISNNLRNKLLIYYESKLQQHYFKEHVLLNSLSEHLRLELFLHSCKSLITSVNLFRNLSKDTIGSIFGRFTPEMYITNDVIAKHGEYCATIWFIAYGSIAIYQEDGIEIDHLTDGDYFGASILEDKERQQESYVFTAVAAETTEVFSISAKDFQRLVQKDRDLRRRVIYYSSKYDKILKQLLERRGEAKRRLNIIDELRKGRILEQPQERPQQDD